MLVLAPFQEASMNASDLIRASDIEEAPEASDEAFAHLIAVAEWRMHEAISQEQDDSDSWHAIHSAQYCLMNVVVALAKSYHIEQFANMALPQVETFQGGGFATFKADLDHYLTQFIVTRSIQNRQDTIIAYPAVRQKIRTYLHHIKEQIDKADLAEDRKAALHKKLVEFEKVLSHDRLNVVTAARIVIEVISLSANALTVADSQMLHKLLNNVMIAMGTERASQAQTRMLQSPASPPAVTHITPRTLKPEPTAKEGWPDLDDEIAF